MLALALLAATPARAIMAGSASGTPPDSPAQRVDANSTASPWAGVGSLSVGSNTYSAVAIAQRYVLTAGHVAKGASPATVKFNLNYGGNLTHRIPAAAVFAHPRFVSINNPDPQHDIAIIELAQDIPAGVPIYPLHFAAVPAGTTLVMVGYGGSGQGDVGASVGANAAVKRVGSNNADAFEADADGSGRSALFMFDFDGGTANGFLGGPTLGNGIETSFAGGDSGSPSFIFAGGQWKVAGINTFIFSSNDGPAALSTFGTGGGGNLLWPYQAWISSILSRPGNDTFLNRFALTGTSGTVSATSAGATKQAGETNHAGNAGGKSVWWKWTAPQDGQVSLNTQGSGFDTLLAVYTGAAVNALAAVAANNDDGSPGNASGLVFAAKAGTEYQIAIDGADGASGTLRMNWSYSESGLSAQVPTAPLWASALLALALALLGIGQGLPRAASGSRRGATELRPVDVEDRRIP